MVIAILVLGFIACLAVSIILTIISARKLKTGRVKCGELSATVFSWVLTGIFMIANLAISLPP